MQIQANNDSLVHLSVKLLTAPHWRASCLDLHFFQCPQPSTPKHISHTYRHISFVTESSALMLKGKCQYGLALTVSIKCTNVPFQGFFISTVIFCAHSQNTDTNKRSLKLQMMILCLPFFHLNTPNSVLNLAPINKMLECWKTIEMIAQWFLDLLRYCIGQTF